MKTPDYPTELLGETENMLECQLTKEEFETAAKKLADTETRYQEFLEHKAEAAKKLAKEKKNIEAERGALSKVVGSGAEFRMVKCELRADFTRNVVLTIRRDTGKVIAERALTSDERQKALFAVEGGKPAEEQPGATEKPENVVEMKTHRMKLEDVPADPPKKCEAVTLGGVCTAHGDDCPDKDTIAAREAKPKDGDA